MELLGAIEGLAALKEPCNVLLHSDSQYVVKAMEQGWARRWRSNGWKRTRHEAALNPDLWARLLELCERHDVRFEWVRGHAGVVENERCDQLAMAAALSTALAVDGGYEHPVLDAPPSHGLGEGSST
jgi:ribonuclease HI